MNDGYGILGEERLHVLLLRAAHLPDEERRALADWANRVLVDYGLLENILAGYIQVGSCRDGHVAVCLTDGGRVALREADDLRKVGRRG